MAFIDSVDLFSLTSICFIFLIDLIDDTLIEVLFGFIFIKNAIVFVAQAVVTGVFMTRLVKTLIFAHRGSEVKLHTRKLAPVLL